VLFARDALRDARPRVPFFLWVLFLGLGNAIPFVLSVVHSYEVAIACGMAMTASWAVAMLRLLRAPSLGRAAWMCGWRWPSPPVQTCWCWESPLLPHGSSPFARSARG